MHFGTNPRIPAIRLHAAEQRWLVDDTHAKGIGYKGGAHGYDNLSPDMQALFIANGPAIKSGREGRARSSMSMSMIWK